MMNLLLEKTLEYFKVTDYRGEIAIKELATLYEMLIDSTLDLAEETRREPGEPGSIVQAVSP